jgi:hypothetical protein
MSIPVPIEDGNQHGKDELPGGNSPEIGLGILARMIVRRLVRGKTSDRLDQVEECTEAGNLVKVTRGNRGIRKKIVRNRT